MTDDDEKREKETLDMRARAGLERLKIGSAPPPTKLWTGLVSHHRDIFVSHVIPKLNTTDRCFFAMANDESWDVLKYAGVCVSELDIRVSECSSISTLELAWNVIDWGNDKDCKGNVVDQAWFCWQVAKTNKLELLKWTREEKKCDWDDRTIGVAACNGNIEMLKYCVDNGCPAPEDLFEFVALDGQLDALKFLIDEKELAYDEQKQVMGNAGYGGDLDIIKYLIEDKKFTGINEKLACLFASISDGHLDCVKYLFEEVKIPEAIGSWQPIAAARYFEQPEVLNYLREKDFPEPSEELYAQYVEYRLRERA